jgi:hypothetical protein
MRTIKTVFTFVGCGGLVLLTGCASVICGPKQAVNLDSRPRGAQVLVYDPNCEMVFSNTTPCTATLNRQGGDSKTGCYLVLIKKDGFAPVQVPLAGRVNGAYYWNFLTAGLGYIVDPMNGSMWTLSPETVDGNLVIGKAGFFSDDGLLISLKENTSESTAPALQTAPVSGFTQVSIGD